SKDGLFHLTTCLFVTHQQPGARVERIAFLAELNVKPRARAQLVRISSCSQIITGRRGTHHADRFTGKNILANGAIDPFHACEKDMVALSHRYYQELPIVAERSRIGDSPVKWGNNLRIGPG